MNAKTTSQVRVPNNAAATNVNTSIGARGKRALNSAFQGVQKATDFVSSSIYILIFVSVVALVIAVIYIVMRVRRFALKSVNLTLDPVINANPMGGEFVRTPGGGLPELAQGNEFTISMWIFVDNIADKLDNDHKIVMYQGNPESYENGGFFIYVDGNTNKMYFSVRTSGVDTTKYGRGNNAALTLSAIQTNKSFITTAIDYVPIQRWVHVLMTVKDATLTVFMDGELYSIATIYDMPMRAGDVRPVIMKPTGDIMVGGKAGAIGVTGYISRAEFYNYSLTLKQAKTAYEEGPYKSSFLKYFGFPNVNFRTPMYFSDSATATAQSGAKLNTARA
jgi:hypothetical protein